MGKSAIPGNDDSSGKPSPEEYRLNFADREADFSLSSAELHRIIHELSVHQIELENQQEELLLSRVKLEKALEHFTELYEFSSQGFLTLLPNSTILEANLTAERLLGVEHTFLNGYRLDAFVALEDHFVFNAVLEKVFSLGQSGFCEIRLFNDNGLPSETESSLQHTLRIDLRIKDDGKQCRAVLSNITRQKQIEQENSRLQKALQNSQQMEMVGQLAGGIAHDYNNMLEVILGHAEMALTVVDPTSSVHDNLGAIHKAAIRSANMTSQLLAFARKQVIVPKIIEFDTLVEEILAMLRRLIGENVSLVWIPGSKNALIKIDPIQIDQILLNLCINARDAVGDGGRITIETIRQSITNVDCAKGHTSVLPGDYVKLIVSDDGCGIDKNDFNHIFEPFFTTKPVGKGTGLGLSTVYGIVKQNKGSIECESQPGQGTAFTIYFPQHGTSSLLSPPVHQKSASIEGKETILLVDDEPDVLELIRGMLEHIGYRVFKAATPEEALNIAEQHRGSIDLILTDVVMPEMNGCNLSIKIKTIIPSIKVLFMSGYNTDVIAGYALIEDGVNFIQKPFSFETLSKAVRMIFNPIVVV